MIKITLDTSCIGQNKKLIERLEELQKEGAIQLYCDQNQFWEKEQLENRLKKLDDLSWMMTNTNDDRYAKEIPEGSTLDDVLDDNLEELGSIYRKVRDIHSPEFSGDKIKTDDIPKEMHDILNKIEEFRTK